MIMMKIKLQKKSRDSGDQMDRAEFLVLLQTFHVEKNTFKDLKTLTDVILT